MTIREHFQRISKRIRYCAVGIVTVLACLLVWRYPHLTRPQIAGAGALLGIPLTIVFMLELRGRFVCPRCRADLGQLHQQEIRRARRERGWFNVEMRSLWDEWNACPRCNVSFDEPHP